MTCHVSRVVSVSYLVLQNVTCTTKVNRIQNVDSNMADLYRYLWQTNYQPKDFINAPVHLLGHGMLSNNIGITQILNINEQSNKIYLNYK